MHHVVDGEIGTELLNKMQRAASSDSATWMAAPVRSTSRAIRSRSPRDLAGMKIRVMQNPVFVDMVNAMGGNGVQSPTASSTTSLQTGVVDGAENNPPSLEENRQYEIASYYTLDEHLIVPEIFVFSKKIWDTLSPVDQQLIRKASALCVVRQRELWAAKETAALEDLKKAGTTVIDNVDKKPFIEATQPVRDKYGAQYADLVKRIMAVQ